MSDVETWTALSLAIPGLLLPTAIVWWKGRPIGPILLLSLVFWPGALILALRLEGRPSVRSPGRKR